MNTIHPLTLKALCRQYGLMPSKQYGQHYLISSAPLEKMIVAAELRTTDTVIEIGPGFGVLTLAVAPLVKKVIAFEIEKKLQPYWEEKMKEYGNVEIVWGNALTQLQTYNPKRTPSYKLLANLPYQITSEALRVILELDPAPDVVVVMVQREVAERICATPGHMSLLSVAVQYYGTPQIIEPVPAGSFWPPPKVESAVISIKTRKQAFDSSSGREKNKKTNQQFFRVVRAGFAHKRKQLWHNLAGELKLPSDEIKQALREIAGNEKVRAEELSVEQWVHLSAQVLRC